MNIEAIIILVYFIGAASSYKTLSRIAVEKAIEEQRKGKVKDETAYAVVAFAIVVSVALWPILIPMYWVELGRAHFSSNRTPIKGVATKRSKRRR